MACPECDIFAVGTRRHSICCGESEISPYKVDRYRERWGLPTLHGTKKEDLVRADIGVINNGLSVDNAYVGYGPGTELLRIYSDAGVPTCEACHDLANKMNRWGVQGCEDRLDEIVDDIVPRAKEWMSQNRPWIHKLLPGIVEDAGIRIRVSGDIKKAIAAAKTNRPTAIPKPTGGCGCGGKLKSPPARLG
jgi:hypothetical protein